MLKKLALGCFLLITLVIGFGFYLVSTLPDEIDVSVSRVIAASTEEIHPLIDDFKRWPEWSYWEAEDSTLTYTYSGNDSGEGAMVKWESDGGPGSMTATASDPAKGFWYDLTLGEGDQGMSSKGVVMYEAVEGGTKVTFQMRGDLDNLYVKIIGSIAAGFVDDAFEYNLKSIAGLLEKE